MTDADAERMLADARARLAEAAARLGSAGARDEVLAELVVPRRLLGLQRPTVLRPIGRVWRLGVLLLTADGSLHATGGIIRVAQPGHHRNVSNLAEERRELRAAALRGRIAVGETVVYDAPTVELAPAALRDATSPLMLTADGLFVRWSSTALAPFDAYLAERVDLLIRPPEGA